MNDYGVILADPPWGYHVDNVNGVAKNHYPTMTKDTLRSLTVSDLAADNSLLLMWTTWPFIPFALELIEVWGFKYKTGFPWIKIRKAAVDLWGETVIYPAWGVGFWTRACTEIVFIATRGSISSPVDPPLGLMGKRFEHSRKPETIYEYAELFTGPYLELFARRQRKGWDVWGNEVVSDIRLNIGELKGISNVSRSDK